MKRLRLLVLTPTFLLLLGCPPTSQTPYYLQGANSFTETSWREYTITTTKNASFTIRTGSMVDYTKGKEVGLFARISDTTKTIDLRDVRVKSTRQGTLKLVQKSNDSVGSSALANTYFFYLQIDKERFDNKNTDSIIVTLPLGERFIFTTKKRK